jgi:hypothetical protein
MQGLDRWKLADELNVYQIALLVAGYDPSDLAEHEFSWPAEVKQEVAPFLSAIKNAAKSGKFTFKEVSDINGTDWEESTIEIETFIAWMRQRNFADGFFIPNAAEVSGIQNPNGPFYAVKLAAAVRAWTEVTSDPAMLNGKSPKKALEVWLRKHANEYGLTGKDGNPNNLGIEEICKVANWKPAGGASPTPSTASRPSPVVRMGRKVPAKAAHPEGTKPGSDKALLRDDDLPF